MAAGPSTVPQADETQGYRREETTTDYALPACRHFVNRQILITTKSGGEQMKLLLPSTPRSGGSSID